MKNSVKLISNKSVEKTPAIVKDNKTTAPARNMREITLLIDVEPDYLYTRNQVHAILEFIVNHDNNYNPTTE